MNHYGGDDVSVTKTSMPVLMTEDMMGNEKQSEIKSGYGKVSPEESDLKVYVNNMPSPQPGLEYSNTF